MHLKKYASLFFYIYTFSLSSHRISLDIRFSECENMFSHNERRRKCGIYVVNAELAQLAEQLIRPKCE